MVPAALLAVAFGSCDGVDGGLLVAGHDAERVAGPPEAIEPVGIGRDVHSSGALVACLAHSVSEGEGLEERGMPAADVWRNVSTAAAACRDGWRPE